MKIRLFCLFLVLGAGAPFLIPKVSAAPENTVTVTATVLEQISYQINVSGVTVATNRKEGVTVQVGNRFYSGQEVLIPNQDSQKIAALVVFGRF